MHNETRGRPDKVVINYWYTTDSTVCAHIFHLQCRRRSLSDCNSTKVNELGSECLDSLYPFPTLIPDFCPLAETREWAQHSN